MVIGDAVDDLDTRNGPLPDVQSSVSDICGSLIISSISSSRVVFDVISIEGRYEWSMTGDNSIAGVGILKGGIVTVPGRALSSDPGSSRSINRGDCPEKLGRVAVFGGTWFVSSNKLLKLLVTESGSNRGLGNSRIYGGVLISNIGGWSKGMSGKVFAGGGKVGGEGAAAWKKDSCIEISSASAWGVEVEEASEGLAAGRGSGDLFRTIESAKN
jgi:hypothetical protein